MSTGIEASEHVSPPAARPANEPGEGPTSAACGDAELDRARAELDDLSREYERALARALGEHGRAMDAAFDEADRLQSRMLALGQRVRRLEARAS